MSVHLDLPASQAAPATCQILSPEHEQGQPAQATAAKSAQQAQHIVPNPLLAPLMQEGTTDMRNPAFGDVEDASEHRPQGTFYAPRGAEYVSIAYMPLQGDVSARP